MKRTVVPGLAVVATLLLAPAAPACESYYLVVFGAQLPTVNRPNYTHSFAVFVKAVGEPCAPGVVVEVVPISWLPKSMEVQVLRLRPEPGRNFSLPETLRWCRCLGLRVSCWGPFLIQKRLYDRALAQAAHLQSGEERYKTLDTGYPSDRVANCIHALGDIAEDTPRLRIGTPGWGDTASYYITLNYLPWIIRPRQTYDWVLGQIGLDGGPLVRRDVERSPTPNPVLRAGQVVRLRRLERASRE